MDWLFVWGMFTLGYILGVWTGIYIGKHLEKKENEDEDRRRGD